MQFIAECYGRQDLSDCVDKLGISDLNVHHMSSNCIKNVVLDRKRDCHGLVVPFKLFFFSLYVCLCMCVFFYVYSVLLPLAGE